MIPAYEIETKLNWDGTGADGKTARGKVHDSQTCMVYHRTIRHLRPPVAARLDSQLVVHANMRQAPAAWFPYSQLHFPYIADENHDEEPEMRVVCEVDDATSRALKDAFLQGPGKKVSQSLRTSIVDA